MRFNESWFWLLVFHRAVLLTLVYCYGRSMINRQTERGWLRFAFLGRPGGLAHQPLEAHYYSNKRIDPLV